ncbi:MAG TPA: methyltransferase domain-containing protein [Actinomycetota bacterium]|nr:methyltransferase domain-containing protein [Actinomycetota bacterium]
MSALDDLVRPGEYPLASRYDQSWVLGLDMGPHPLWLLEDLLRDLDLEPGMRVLDLGSGGGATSVFLAREAGVEVFAVDLWVEPDGPARVFAEAGVGGRVHALKGDARALPFAAEYFDAVVSIDAFEYFGTGDDYLPYLLRYLKTGGAIGIATPALARGVDDLGGIPPHIARCVGWEAAAWHTAEWWRSRWEATGLVTVDAARLQAGGWHDWVLWTRACLEQGAGDPAVLEDVLRMLEADAGELLTFALVAARKRA